MRAMGATDEQLKAQFSNSSLIRSTVEQALNCYPSEWITASVKHRKIPLKKIPPGERGFYDGRQIKIEDKYHLDSAIHELGHRMENVNEEIFNAEKEFYNRRTAGEPLEKLSVLTGNSNYRADERARKDKFLDAYVGKDYGGTGYELVSMGFQWAYTNPAFLLQDEDMAQWIYGLLAIGG